MKDEMGVPELLQQIKLVENEVGRVKEAVTYGHKQIYWALIAVLVLLAVAVYHFW